MFHYLLHAVATEPAVAVGEEAADEGLCHLGHLHVVRELEGVLVVHDLVVGSDQGVGIKRRVPNQHLVKKHTDAPPVALPPILTRPALGFEDLWGNVVRGPHRRLGPDHPVRSHLHTGPKVREFEVALGVQQHVVRFNVPETTLVNMNQLGGSERATFGIPCC